MNPSYIGAVWIFAGNFAPINFHFCDGSLQAISENEAMYALLGTTYGGDGVNTFGLPDLRGRSVISQGTGPGLPSYVLGQMAGTEQVTITTGMMASHTHLLNAGTSATAQASASNLYVNAATSGGSAANFFSNGTPNATLASGSVGLAGSNIPIEILQPVTAISYIIALYGIFPTQN